MIFPEMDFLSSIGWNKFYLENERKVHEQGRLARVIGEEKNL